jgi:leucyl aminopeptidase
MAWTKRDLALAGKGATGFGVRLLDRLIADHYES